MEGLIRVYHECIVCGTRFEVVDGVGICCGTKCWDKFDEMEEESEDE